MNDSTAEFFHELDRRGHERLLEKARSKRTDGLDVRVRGLAAEPEPVDSVDPRRRIPTPEVKTPSRDAQQADVALRTANADSP